MFFCRYFTGKKNISIPVYYTKLGSCATDINSNRKCSNAAEFMPL